MNDNYDEKRWNAWADKVTESLRKQMKPMNDEEIRKLDEDEIRIRALRDVEFVEKCKKCDDELHRLALIERKKCDGTPLTDSEKEDLLDIEWARMCCYELNQEKRRRRNI